MPANHGGFETAAERIGTDLVQRGWRVIVYCQLEGEAEPRRDVWRGIERVFLPSKFEGAKGTIVFDAKVVQHVLSDAGADDICLTFGYNTAFLNYALKAKGLRQLINMDGIEWSRQRWSRGEKAFLYANERLGCWVGDHLIADHPAIRTHLETRVSGAKITTVAYGADAVLAAPPQLVTEYGVEPGRYAIVVARPVPENSVLEIVRGFSAERRGIKLLVLGNYDPTDAYHAEVLDAASDEVVFAGAVYQPQVTQALRLHAVAYLHGHTVGGTNPSLVEALGCGNPVIAHDNKYNRGVAEDAGLYFVDHVSFAARLVEVLEDADLRERMSERGRERHAEHFTWQRITDQYEAELCRLLPDGGARFRATREAEAEFEASVSVPAPQRSGDHLAPAAGASPVAAYIRS